MPCFVDIDFLQSPQLRSYPAHVCYVEKISFIQRNLYFSTLFLSVVAGCKFWWAQTTITTRDKVFLGKGNPWWGSEEVFLWLSVEVFTNFLLPFSFSSLKNSKIHFDLKEIVLNVNDIAINIKQYLLKLLIWNISRQGKGFALATQSGHRGDLLSWDCFLHKLLRHLLPGIKGLPEVHDV